MPVGKIHAEDQYEYRGQQQGEVCKTIANEIAELFANDRGHLRRKQTQAIGAFFILRHGTNGGARRCGGFTDVFTPGLSCDPAAPKSAKQQSTESKSARTHHKKCGWE